MSTSSLNLSLDNLAIRLRDRLGHALPGTEAQVQMAPRYSARENALSVEGRNCREAGVLALLYPDDDPYLVLTVRRDDLPDHPGQVSFPGGQREAGETLPETALREAKEEVNLTTDPVEVLGALTPLFVPPSNFCVHPFVGVLDHRPSLSATDREVGAILRVPISHLLDPETRVVETWTLHGQQIDVPYYRVEGHTVWGATAMMLSELLACVRDVV
ncbi:coenzyme A pyrophosphatase [Longibacter salinarum]|uniref:Coenzyme A pyrophosphatase n=1 Tax=Longibacter salinarum TaxID=1850348 RepID=A0A2A8D0W8_9BACT|nr:CoA pyrophosphatase [Longibacter salinarum]PEN14575.1 coenzyme A pyrophosphatase [Longibacter salinarum]